ncbi:UNVERIFIED_CONTAM: hypothetical protein NCL1_48515 [Trichonephila clavipes]
MMSSDAVRINLNECMQKYDEYSERFFALLPVFGKKSGVRMVHERRDGLCIHSGKRKCLYTCLLYHRPISLNEKMLPNTAIITVFKHAQGGFSTIGCILQYLVMSFDL